MTLDRRADVTAKELAERLRSNTYRAPAIASIMDQAADELDRLAGEVERLREPKNWKDDALPEDDEIAACHALNSKRFDLDMEARRLVGACHSKYKLVGLVNMLLHRIDRASPPEAGTTGGRTGAGK